MGALVSIEECCKKSWNGKEHTHPLPSPPVLSTRGSLVINKQIHYVNNYVLS